MGLRDLRRRLRRAYKDTQVLIEQPDGEPPARFPEAALKDAFLTTMDRLCGRDVKPHPLALAAARSPDPGWNQSFYADDGGPVTIPEDLSE